MVRQREIVIFGPLPPPYGGVAIYDTLLGLGFEKNEIQYRHFSDASLDGINNLKPSSIILDMFYYSLEIPDRRKIFKCLFTKFRKKLHWIKVIHNGSLPDRYNSYSWKKRMLFRISLYLFDRFVVVNNTLKEWLISSINVNKPVHVISSLLPIPMEYIEPDNDDILEDQDNDKIVTSIGVFIKEFGFSDIADAVQLVRDETGIDIKLNIIDAGFTNDREYEASLLDGRDWIVVHRQIPHPDSLKILRNSDVFVRATHYESYGLSRVEALLCGTPVIATNVGETRGMSLFEPGNVPALKENLSNTLFKQDRTEVQSLNSVFLEEAECNLRKIIELTKL